jgi:hypothetical protein
MVLIFNIVIISYNFLKDFAGFNSRRLFSTTSETLPEREVIDAEQVEAAFKEPQEKVVGKGFLHVHKC